MAYPQKILKFIQKMFNHVQELDIRIGHQNWTSEWDGPAAYTPETAQRMSYSRPERQGPPKKNHKTLPRGSKRGPKRAPRKPPHRHHDAAVLKGHKNETKKPTKEKKEEP